MKKLKLLVVLLTALSLLTGCIQGPAAETSSTKTSLKEVTRGNLLIGLTADGTIALPVTPLNFEVSGKISEIYVSTGSEVKKGDVLAELDDSDLQIVLENAKISLSKAEASYQDALVSAEYNLKTETKNLEDLKAKYNEPFDSYTYEKSITDAQTNLSRKAQDLNDAKKALDEAEAATLANFDSYTYDTSISNALVSLERKKSDLADAQKALNEAKAEYDSYLKGTYYDYNIKNLQTSLERKQSDLKDAEADALAEQSGSTSTSLQRRQEELTEAERILADALSDKPALFDSYTYDLAITNAETTLKRRQEELTSAKNDLFNELLKYPYEYRNNIDTSQLDKAIASAEKSLEDAQTSYDKAVSDLTRALEKYIDDCQTKVDSLKLDVGDLQTSADSRVKTARLAVDDAQFSLDKAQSDLKNSLSKAVDDAQSKVKTAQLSVDDAQISYDKAVTDLARAKFNHISDSTDKLKTDLETAQTKYNSAKNSYDDAAASLNAARESLARAKASYEKELENTLHSISMSELKIENMKNSTSSIDNAFYNVEDAKNNLKTAENNLAKIKIISPIDGAILNITKKVGEVVSGSDGAANPIMGALGASSGVISLCDTSEIYLTTSVTESDINSVEVGQTIRVSVEALDNKEIYATVESVSSIPSVDSSGIITYEVIGKLNEVDKDIKDNMSLFLTFIKKEREDVLIVPNKAVFVEDGQQYVYVAKNGDANNLEKRAVTCGLSNGTQTEVAEGLQEGEIVAIKGVSYS